MARMRSAFLRAPFLPLALGVGVVGLVLSRRRSKPALTNGGLATTTPGTTAPGTTPGTTATPATVETGPTPGATPVSPPQTLYCIRTGLPPGTPACDLHDTPQDPYTARRMIYGQPLSAFELLGDWIHVRHPDGQVGWILASNVASSLPPPVKPTDEPVGPTPGPPVEIDLTPAPPIIVAPLFDARPGLPGGIDIVAPPPPAPPFRLARTVAHPTSRFVTMWTALNDPESTGKALVPRGVHVETHQMGKETIGQRGAIGERRQLGDYVYAIFRPQEGGSVQGWIPIEEIRFYDQVSTGQIRQGLAIDESAARIQTIPGADLTPLPYDPRPPPGDLRGPRIDVRTGPIADPVRPPEPPLPPWPPPGDYMLTGFRNIAAGPRPTFVIMHREIDNPSSTAKTNVPLGEVVQVYETVHGYVPVELQVFDRDEKTKGFQGLYTRVRWKGDASGGAEHNGWIYQYALVPMSLEMMQHNRDRFRYYNK